MLPRELSAAMRDGRETVVDAKRVWLRFLVLIPLAAALIFASRAYIQHVGGTYSMDVPVSGNAAALSVDDVTFQHEGIVEVVSIEPNAANESARLTIRSLNDGDTILFVNAAAFSTDIHVGDGVIIEDGVDFTGWESILISIIVFLATVVALLTSALHWLYKRVWFGYEMVVCCGALIFTAVQLVLFAIQPLSGQAGSFSSLAVGIVGATDRFLFLSFVPIAASAVAVIVSNISLIRHEGLRLVNVLGIAVCTGCLAVNVWWLFFGETLYSTLQSSAAIAIVDSIVAVAIAYGECLLLAIILCAWHAARRAPQRPADYVIILGCGLLPDGSPTPLLRGRIDRALAFDAQLAQHGSGPVTYVASGGQGPDEVVSEAESMRRYLMDQGIPDGRILLEDRSARTIENMRFSRAAIESASGCDASQARVAFSTTNYHVFRGYVCAHKAGMGVEGMASPTRAYFWPNAFVREILGLIADRWYAILITYALIAIANGCLQYALALS